MIYVELVLWLALLVFASIGVFVTIFALVCVADSRKMRRGK